MIPRDHTGPEPPQRTVVLDKAGCAWQRHGDVWVSTKPHDDERRRSWSALLAGYAPLLVVPDFRIALADDNPPLQLIQHGVGRGCPRVEGRCPACGGRSLFLGAGARVTCAVLRCPSPCGVDDYLDPIQCEAASGTGRS